jgi:hypothetical protein
VEGRTVTYLQVDDRFADHPKVAVLSDAAFRAQVTALCYCAEHLTDGMLPKTVGDRFARPRPRRELLASGLWMEAPGGYSLHDYLDWNPSREEVLARLASKKAAGARGGAAAAARASATQRHIGVEQGSGLERTQESLSFEAFWAAYPTKIAKKSAKKAWETALKSGASAEEIVAGAERYRDDPNRSATAHPTTWLHQERWNDGPLPSFGDAPKHGAAARTMELARRMEEAGQ